MAEVYEETRARLVEVALDGARTCRTTRRAGSWCWPWFAFTEDLVGQWVQEPTMTASGAADACCRDVLDRLLTR